MPDTQQYRLFLANLVSVGNLKAVMCFWRKGYLVFPGYHVWDNRYHRGDGPLFHAIAYVDPPTRYATVKGQQYLYIGCDEQVIGKSYIWLNTDGHVVISAQATFSGSGSSMSISNWSVVAQRADLDRYVDGPQAIDGTVYSASDNYYQNPSAIPREIGIYAAKTALIAHGYEILAKVKSGTLRKNVTDFYDTLVRPFPGDLFQMSFDHNEYMAYEGWKQLGIDGLPNLYRSGFASAYVSAMQGIPEIRCNMIANVLEVISTLRDIKNGKFFKGIRDTLKDPRSLWLSYRYAYSTTKMDVQEVSSVISRLHQLLDAGVDFKVNGTYRRGDMLFRACATIPLSTVLPDSKVVSKLDKLGLKLSAYNLWDMIPYSFVVDWFLGVGDLIEWAESLNAALEVEVSNVWYSCQTVKEDLVTYFRISASGITGTPFYDTKNASTKTLLMRFTDALALFS